MIALLKEALMMARDQFGKTYIWTKMELDQSIDMPPSMTSVKFEPR